MHKEPNIDIYNFVLNIYSKSQKRPYTKPFVINIFQKGSLAL
jgi:hypothetical protein